MTGVPRKPLGEDSECGVCFEALVEGARAEGMSYCNVCGNSLHTAWYVAHGIFISIPSTPKFHLDPPDQQPQNITHAIQLRQVEGPERDPLRPGPLLRLLPRHQLGRARLSERCDACFTGTGVGGEKGEAKFREEDNHTSGGDLGEDFTRTWGAVA